jgi:hypothetical protein
MAPLAGSVLTKRNAWAEAGLEARAANYSGPDLLTLRRPCATVFSLAVMGGFLLLAACAKAPAPETQAALPAQRNLSVLAPTPCTIPNAGQTDTPNVLNSPQQSTTDRLRVECLRGVPPPRTTWSWSGPSGVAPERPQADRASAERAREEAIAFQSRQRAGR